MSHCDLDRLGATLSEPGRAPIPKSSQALTETQMDITLNRSLEMLGSSDRSVASALMATGVTA